eukprot:394037-Rhodomonas_salina.1
MSARHIAPQWGLQHPHRTPASQNMRTSKSSTAEGYIKSHHAIRTSHVHRARASHRVASCPDILAGAQREVGVTDRGSALFVEERTGVALPLQLTHTNTHKHKHAHCQHQACESQPTRPNAPHQANTPPTNKQNSAHDSKSHASQDGGAPASRRPWPEPQRH